VYKKNQHIHFVGIGGIGMSGIAEVLLNLGYRVSGSDLAASDVTDRLKKLGATIGLGHRPSNVTDPQVVVVSSAVRRDNPEVVVAREKGIPVIPRAEMLAELMRLKWGIAIAGAHGKTTTTTMVAHVLAHGGLDPTAVIGGRVNAFGSNAKLGGGQFLIAEADESDGSFLKLSPVIAVITNIDREHMDHYGDMNSLLDAFVEFANLIPFYGLNVVCMDCEHIREILPRIEKRVITYGFSSQADFRAENVKMNGLRSGFRVMKGAETIGEVDIPAPGLHNVLNALATTIVALEIDIPFEKIKGGLNEFSGIRRRFQFKGKVQDIIVVDDYGHHPTEVRATLAAARAAYGSPSSGGKRLVVVFQPHRYTRTRDLSKEFMDAFDDADVLILTDIYAAGEAPIAGVTGELIYREVKEGGHKNVTYVPDRRDIARVLRGLARDNDVVMTLGAGDVYKVGEEFVKGATK